MSDEAAVEPLGVGVIRAIRTFRVGHDGGLYPVNTAAAWTPGWNIATCARGRAHTPPDPDCRCGFYVYFHPAYTSDQPPARQVLGIVEVRGVMEVGTRGARVPEARIVGLWLGTKVSGVLADRVAARYPGLRIFRDQAELLEQFPVTPVEGTRAPRATLATRTLARRAMWTYAAVAVVVGLIPTHAVTQSTAGAALWLTTLATGFALLVGGLLARTPMTACVGSVATAWLTTNNLNSPGGIAYRGIVPALVLWVVLVWRRAARPGEVIRDDKTVAAARRWWFRRIDGH